MTQHGPQADVPADCPREEATPAAPTRPRRDARGGHTYWTAAAAACAIALGAAAVHAALAAARAREASARLARVSAEAAALAEARASMPGWARRAPEPPSGLAQRFAAALAAANLPPQALAGLSAEPEPQRQPAQGGIERRRASVSLTGLTLPQLGALLSAWRSREPGWVVAGIEAQPDPAPARDARPGSDLPLRVGLSLQSTTVRTPEGAGP